MTRKISIGANLLASTRISANPVDTRCIMIGIGDFNSDGLLDYAVSGMDVGANASATNDIRIMLSQGSGRFVEGTSILKNVVPTYQTNSLVTADLNRDGFTDIVVGRAGGDTDTTDGVYGATQLVYLSKGDGTYESIQSSRASYIHNAVVSDVNKDTYPDAFYFATSVGTSELMLSNKNTVVFSNENLPRQAKIADQWLVQDIIETYPNGAMKKGQIWHQHNTAFNDVNRDGSLDMVMFFGSGSNDGLIYLNDGRSTPNFSISEAIKFDARIPGILSTGSYQYGILNSDGSWAGLKLSKQGANYYETVQFDINRDGWSDIVALATMNNKVWIHDDKTNKDIFEEGTDRFNHGTFYKVLINSGNGLSDDTQTRIKQPAVTTKALDGNGNPNHNGHINNMRVLDLNGDGNFDFMNNLNALRSLNMKNYENEPQTIFMLNNGKGVFEQVIIDGMENDSYDAIPIDGKLAFVATIVPTDHEWETQGFPQRPDYQFYYYKTDVPWTKGDEKNNFVYGTVANDTVDGAQGADTYVALGRSSEFKVSIQKENITIDDLSGLGGVDILANVERIRFYNETIAYDIAGNAGQAYRLYKAALDRIPDAIGLASWIKYMDDGAALTSMAQQFIDSQEFIGKYGALDNTGFVNQLYINVLARKGEATGVEAWVNGLANGLTRAQVLAGFSESSENQANVIGQIKDGIAYNEWWLA
jgi:hypothetical protein